MTVTCCVGAFAKRLQSVPVTRAAFQAELAKIPRSCDRDDCSAGGCRKHCIDYANGAWVVATSAFNKPIPKAKPAARRKRR